jgi:hypothetical protein
VDELEGDSLGTLIENMEELALPFLSGEELIRPFSSSTLLDFRELDGSIP